MRNDIKKLKKQLEAMKKANSSIYLKLNDCIYKTIGAGEIVEVDSIPDDETVEEVDCTKEQLIYLFYIQETKQVHYLIDDVGSY